jgi:hypothetical protein
MTVSRFTNDPQETFIAIAEEWPELRVPCAALHSIIGGSHSKLGPNSIRSATCNEAACRGWTPVTDWGSIATAVRERGWVIELTSNPEGGGDWVAIVYSDLQAGYVAPSDKLRGTHALAEAIRRAQEAQYGHDEED